MNDADANAAASPPPSKPVRSDTLRLTAVAVYVLYLLALPLGITAIIGVIMAYAGRSDALGSAFESHFDNAIVTFWVFFVAMLAIVPLCFILVGLPLLGILYVWMIYRTVKGLLRAWDFRPYNG